MKVLEPVNIQNPKSNRDRKKRRIAHRAAAQTPAPGWPKRTGGYEDTAPRPDSPAQGTAPAQRLKGRINASSRQGLTPPGRREPRHPPHLADEPRDEQQHQDAVVVPAVAQEAVGHEGGEEGDVPVGLLHLHLAQLHLDGLREAQGQGSPPRPLPSPAHPSPFGILKSRNRFPPAGTQQTAGAPAATGNISHCDQPVPCGGAWGRVPSSGPTPGAGHAVCLRSQAFLLSSQRSQRDKTNAHAVSSAHAPSQENSPFYTAVPDFGMPRRRQEHPDKSLVSTASMSRAGQLRELCPGVTPAARGIAAPSLAPTRWCRASVPLLREPRGRE